MTELIFFVGVGVLALLQFGLHAHLVKVINDKSAAFNANPIVQNFEDKIKAKL